VPFMNRLTGSFSMIALICSLNCVACSLIRVLSS
jgi:hypothetical protein